MNAETVKQNTLQVVAAVENLLEKMPEASMATVPLALTKTLFATLKYINDNYDNTEGFIESIEYLASVFGFDVSIQVSSKEVD